MTIQGNYNNYTNYTPQEAQEQNQAAAVAQPEAPQAPSTPSQGANNTSPLSIVQQTQIAQQENTLMLLQQMFNHQASVSSFASGQENRAATPLEEILAGLEGITQEQAAEYVSEDGFWGVERTAQRLFDHALRLSGGNERDMQNMLRAIDRGLEAAERQWGGDLPEISGQTRDRIHEMFDDWFGARAE